MREDAHAERSEFVEDVREQRSVVDLKVKAGLVGQTHDLSEDESHIFDEERVDE